MKNIAKITRLFDTYGKLLSIKQQEYIIDYYFSDFSLGEIAQRYKITRNAVYSTIKDAINDLNYYENVLKLIAKQDKILKLYELIDNEKLRKELISIELDFNKVKV